MQHEPCAFFVMQGSLTALHGLSETEHNSIRRAAKVSSAKARAQEASCNVTCAARAPSVTHSRAAFDEQEPLSAPHLPSGLVEAEEEGEGRPSFETHCYRSLL